MANVAHEIERIMLNKGKQFPFTTKSTNDSPSASAVKSIPQPGHAIAKEQPKNVTRFTLLYRNFVEFR